MAITKTITANGSKGHHKFTLTVNEDRTSGNSSFNSLSFVLSPIQKGWDWVGYDGKIAFEISIGDNNYTGTIPSYNGSSAVTLKSVTDIEIPHNSDGTKTINISFKVTDTTGASYTCGNASAESTMELSKLHEAPLLSNVTFKETNQQLKNIGVGDDYFVTNLSIKNIQIEASTFDNATITKYEILNGDKVYSSTTNVVQMNLQQNLLETLFDSGLNREVAKLTIRLTDSLGGVSSFAYPYNYVIKYTKPSIEKTSTTIKRKTGNGVVLTDNIAVLNFVGSCYKCDDVVGSNNKPTVQYKIWNTTEPESYTNLTTQNIANVTVENYEINDILYTSSYNYKIKIIDNFTTTETTINVKIDRVPTGKSVWTEYKDRIDFEKITIKNNDVFSYSTDEIVVGTWINSKPIYRKTIVLTKNVDFSSNNTTVNHNILNIDEITELRVMCFSSTTGLYRPFAWTYFTSQSDSKYYGGVAVNKTNFKLEIGTSLYDDMSKLNIIIEYTKTTD
jgi:hypothetical protein